MTKRHSTLPPPGGISINARSSQDELNELRKIQAGARLTLKERTLIHKLVRELGEAQQLLLQSNHPAFLQKAQALAKKWGLLAP